MKPTLEDIMVAAPLEPSPVCFRAIYGNDHPVELEVGSGKGGFLLEQARVHPERNYFGIEWANKYCRYAADRMVRWELSNVRMCRTDAKIFVLRCVQEQSLDAMHVYHPDPWPKKRHHRRRLFDADFVSAAARVLRDGATLSYQTDHAEYGAIIAGLLEACPALERTLDASQNGAHAADIVPTNFQVKYEREGRAIRRQTFRRRPRT